VASYREAFARLAEDPSVNPMASIIRIDATALFTHVIGRPLGVLEWPLNLGLLALGAAAVARSSRRASPSARTLEDPKQERFTLMVACFAILPFAYHQAYDILLLVLPGTALICRRVLADMRPARAVLLALVLIPAMNYLGSVTAAHFLGIPPDSTGYRLLSSINGAMVLVGFLVVVALAFTGRQHRERVGDSRPTRSQT
jgi:predicted MFS family arabinose efflux permease